MKLSIIIPTYNEKNTILTVLGEVRQTPFDKEIIIIDDGSTDGSREILANLNTEGITLLFHERNMGKGASLRTGIKHATGDIVIFQDADLEYDPADYCTLVEPFTSNSVQAVYGDRFSGKRSGYTIYYLGNRLVTLLTNLLYGSNLNDMEVGYKAYRRDLIQSLEIKANGFDIEPEITARVLKRGIRIYQVPISYKARSYGEGKKIGIRDGFIALWTLVKYRFVD